MAMGPIGRVRLTSSRIVWVVLAAALSVPPIQGQPSPRPIQGQRSPRPIQGQRSPRPPAAQLLDRPFIGAISLSADQHGRRAFCDELIRVSTSEPKAVRLVPENAELRCLGPLVNRIELRSQSDPKDSRRVLCEFVRHPALLVFWKMKPIALRRGAVPSDPHDLELTLGKLGATTLARTLEAFGFGSLTARSAGAAKPLDEIGVHELELACADSA